MQHPLTRIRLDLNENPFGPSPMAVKAMQAALERGNRYPENSARELRRKLAQLHGVEQRQILVAGGLTDLLGVLARAFLGPGLNAVTSERSFTVYRIATHNAGGRLIEVPMLQEGFDLPALAAAIDGNTRIVFVANPNNPTGTIVSAEELERFLDQVPEHVVVVLDEAYHDYAQHFATLRGVEYSRSLDYVRQKRRAVVLRTFSKAHGLAGMRVGYGIALEELISALRSQRTIYCVSEVAQAGALAALDDEAHVRRAVQNNAHEAVDLRATLSRLGYPTPTPWGNFLYCEVGKDGGDVAGALEQEGIAVRALQDYGAPNAIRITIGTPEQNASFLQAFSKIMKE
jgi:histidinol-phosphate aminotransferase